MRQTGFFHHIGTFLLFVACILAIITCISAPVVHQISMVKVTLGNGDSSSAHTTVTFGTFGWCINNADGSEDCSRSAVGYNPTDVLMSVDGSLSFSTYRSDTVNALTKVMILHPIVAGLAFIAFLLALGAGVVGSFMASLVALVTFVVTLAVLVTDFVGWSLLRSAVNDANDGTSAEYGTASWTILVSAICSFLAMFVVFFTCCSARLHNRRSHGHKAERWDSPPAATTTTTRRRWF